MKRQIAIVAVLATAAAGAGCGGSDSGSGPGPGGGTPSAMDAFFTAVKSIISSSDDTAAPVSVEAVVATTPDDSVPETVY